MHYDHEYQEALADGISIDADPALKPKGHRDYALIGIIVAMVLFAGSFILTMQLTDGITDFKVLAGVLALPPVILVATLTFFFKLDENQF